jgi:hypothetical protein
MISVFGKKQTSGTKQSNSFKFGGTYIMQTKKFFMALVAVLMVFGAAGLAAPAFAADGDGNFTVQAYHGINGNVLGLSKELPVDISIYDANDYLVAFIPGFTFKDRIEAALPEGTYTVRVTSQEAGPLPSMTVGPVFIPADAEVRLHARLLPSVAVPSIVVKVK